MEAEPPALTFYPQVQGAGWGTYSIWNIPGSPPEWVLGLDMVV